MNVFRHQILVNCLVQVRVVRKVQESSSPDTEEQIKELDVKSLSDLIASSDGNYASLPHL